MKKKLHFFKIRIFIVMATLQLAFSALAASGDVVYSETFDTEDDFNAWTIVDLNGGRTWEPLNGAASYMLDYQTGLPGDDWYISPAVSLESGKVYELSFYLGILSKTENLRVCLGTSENPDDFTTVIADFNSVQKGASGDKAYKLLVPSDGQYRIGFYAYSEPNMHRIDIDNVAITEVSSVSVPGEVTNLTVTPGAKGAKTATVAFDTPTVDAGGSPLAELASIAIYRNEEQEAAKTYASPEVGASFSWTDENPEPGFNTYRVVAYNAAGNSREVAATEFIGFDTPVEVSSLLARLNADMSISLVWEAPAASVNGGYVDFENMVYRVLRDGVELDAAVAETEFNDPRPVQQGQQLVSYTVIAVAGDKESSPVTSNSVLNGEPLALPYAESFAGQRMVTPWTLDGEINAFDWHTICDDSEIGEFEEVPVQDGDDGMIVAESRYADYGDQARFVSPMLEFGNISNPTLTFWFYQARSPWYDPEWDGEVNDRLQVQVSYDGGEWQNLENATYYLNETPAGWVECSVTLPKKECAFFNIGLLATAESDVSAYRNMYVDAISVDEAPFAADLVADAFAVDSKRVGVGEEMAFSVVVFNRGADAVANYSVALYRDGEKVDEKPGKEIAPAQKADIGFSVVATLDDAVADSFTWIAEILFDDDENLGNNKTDEIVTSVRKPTVPAVADLIAEASGVDVALSWSPSSSIPATPKGEPVTVTDDFEDYEPFVISGIGDWAVADLDEAATLNTPRIPVDYPHRGEPMAFQVFNTTKAGVWVEGVNIDNAFMPHSGEQYLACPSVEYPAENDDWLITPRLYGRAHVVSFYAKAATYDSEWINVYYSTSDNHPDSFIKLNEGDRLFVNDGWTKYEFEVPDGTRYFAVRCVRRCVFLFIDDFTYNAHDGSADPATFLGYNVYRDGKKINDELLADNRFTDTGAAESGYAYKVTAVYEEGESEYSNEATVKQDGAVGIVADGISITTNGNMLFVRCTSPERISVYTIDGRMAYDGTTAEAAIELPTNGVYLVKIRGTVRKVAL